MSSRSALAAKDEEKRQRGYAHEWAFKHTYRNDLPTVPSAPLLISSVEHDVTPDYLYKYRKNIIYASECLPIDRESHSSMTLVSKGASVLESDFFVDQYAKLKEGPKSAVQGEHASRMRDSSAIRPILIKDEVFLQKPRPPGSKPSAQIPVRSLFLQQKTQQMGNVKLFGRNSSSNEQRGPGMLLSQRIKEKVRQNSITPDDYAEIVNKTFKDANSIDLKTLKHPKNSSLTATEIIPIIPNVKLAKNEYALATFDSDPLLRVGETPAEDASEVGSDTYIRHNEAILKKGTDPKGEEMFSYYTLDDAGIKRFKDEQDNIETFGEDYEDEEVDEDGKRKPYVYEFIRDYDLREGDVSNSIRLALVFSENENGEKYAFIKTVAKDFHLKRKAMLKDGRERKRLRVIVEEPIAE